MSALPWIAAAIGGGALYLWWKSRSQPQGGGACAALCAQLPPGAQGACLTTCNALGGALQSFDGGAGFVAERDRRQAVNDKLNGPAEVKNPAPPFRNSPGETPENIQSNVLRYQNGCVPLYDAPGFAKCAEGTLDMYRTAIGAVSQDLDFGGDAAMVAEGAFPTIEARQSYESAHPDSSTLYRRINKTHAMTGQSGDPTTQGPTAGGDGRPSWTVRGRNVTCNKGQAPRAVLLQMYDDSATDTDDQASECLDVFANPRVISQGGGCANGMPTISGTTWDPTLGGGTGAWRRLRAGETVNPGPCAVVPGLSIGDATAHYVEIK